MTVIFAKFSNLRLALWYHKSCIFSGIGQKLAHNTRNHKKRKFAT